MKTKTTLKSDENKKCNYYYNTTKKEASKRQWCLFCEMRNDCKNK